MRKFIFIGILIAVIFSLLSAPSQAEPSKTEKPVVVQTPNIALAQAITSQMAVFDLECGERKRWTSYHWNDGTLGADEWHFQFDLHYEFCKTQGEDSDFWYTQSEFGIGKYNFEGTKQDCNTFIGAHKMKYVSFNLYTWTPYNGRNFNPPAFKVGCREDTTNSKLQEYQAFGATTPKLWFHSGEAPYGKVLWELHRTGVIFPDVSDSGLMHMRLRKCSGYANNKCK